MKNYIAIIVMFCLYKTNKKQLKNSLFFHLNKFLRFMNQNEKIVLLFGKKDELLNL